MDACLYDELHRVEQTHWWFRARRHIVWSLVGRYVPGLAIQRLRVCELGCGTGGNIAPLADTHDVVGVECSPHALAYARRSLANCFRYGKLPHDIDLPPQSFDVVLMTDVLEHIEDDRASAKVAISLLRQGGVLVATVPAYQWLYSPRDAQHHHFRRYGKKQFAKLWPTAACKIELLSYYNTLLFPIAAAARLGSKFSKRESSGDLTLPPKWINEHLTGIMRCELNLLGRVPMPFGLSLIAVLRKRASAAYQDLRQAA